MNARHRFVLTVSLVLLLVLGACGTQSTTPTSAPGAGTTAVASVVPTATPTPSPTPPPTPTPTPIPMPTDTPVALSFIQMPTQILVGGRTDEDTSTADVNYGFYSIDTDGTNVHRVDPVGMVNVYPSWSPDGKQIAYSRIVNISSRTGWMNAVIVVMDADGTGGHLLTSTDEFAINPVWSPEGSQIAFERFTRPTDPEAMPDAVVSVMNADGSNLHDVGRVGYLIGTPSWSPDGSKLVFAGSSAMEPSADQPAPFFINVVHADGSNLQSIVGPGVVISPSWSPDGSKILYEKFNELEDPFSADAAPSQMMDVWVVNPDGSNPQPLTGDQFSMAFFPAWSPDGTQIAFIGVHPASQGSQSRGDTSIYVANADGTNLRQIAADPTVMPMAPSWSPDGQAIAYLAATSISVTESDGANAELRVVAADGSEQGTLLAGLLVEPAFDPFDSLGSTAPVWRPVQP